MTFSLGLVYDLLFLALLAAVTLTGLRRGFAAGLVRLIGSVGGIVGAVFITRSWAPALYDQYIGAPIGDKVAAALTEQGANIPELLGKYLSILPQSMRDTLAAGLQNAAQSNTVAVSQQVVAALEPLLLPMLQCVLFLLTVLVVRALFRLLESLLRHLNGVPLLGTVNKMLGFCFGFVTGTLDCWLLSILLWLVAAFSDGGIAWLNTAVLSTSGVYTLFSHLNPFLTK